MVKWSGGLTGESQFNPASLYTRQLKWLAGSILNDDSHPLYKEFQLLPPGGRFTVEKCRTKQYKNCFVPAAINQLSKMFTIMI